MKKYLIDSALWCMQHEQCTTRQRENRNARSRILFNEIRKQIVQGMMIRYQNLINISIAFKCNHFYLIYIVWIYLNHENTIIENWCKNFFSMALIEAFAVPKFSGSFCSFNLRCDETFSPYYIQFASAKKWTSFITIFHFQFSSKLFF